MEDKIINLQISVKDVNVILKQLTKVKYEKVANLINIIQKQSVAQISTTVTNDNTTTK